MTTTAPSRAGVYRVALEDATPPDQRRPWMDDEYYYDAYATSRASAAVTLADIRSISEIIGGASDVLEACQRAAGEIKRITGYDRIMVYRFLPDGSPDPGLTAGVMEAAKVEGLLIGKGGLFGNTLRIAPPLTLTEEEAEEGLDKLTRAIDRAREEQP